MGPLLSHSRATNNVATSIGRRSSASDPCLPLAGRRCGRPFRPCRAGRSQDAGRANVAARVQPEGAIFLNPIQKYAWTDGALFQIYTAPGQVTDTALREGEEIVGPGSIAAGDTVRWIIGDTQSGAGASRRAHILVQPTRSDIVKNLGASL